MGAAALAAYLSTASASGCQLYDVQRCLTSISALASTTSKNHCRITG